MDELQELWEWIYGAQINFKSGVKFLIALITGRIFYAIIMFLVRKYFTDRDKDVKTLFKRTEQNNIVDENHEARLKILEHSYDNLKKEHERNSRKGGHHVHKNNIAK